MSTRGRLALLAAGLLMTVLLRPVIAGYLSEPLGLLYGLGVRFVESLPQIYIWATLLGAFVLIGLRQLPLADRGPMIDQPARIERSGRLGSWTRLLVERHRGAYFDWRLANRLAELEAWIGAAGPADQAQRAYLRIGREARTIEAGHELAGLNLKLKELVGYLEDALNRN